MRKIPKFQGKGNILLVERDSELRAFASGTLIEAGYTVFEAEDGYQAFLMSESLSQPLHLLLAEVDLGAELGGVELSRHLQVLRPGLRVLFLSTVPANPDLRRELQAMLDSYLSKPYTSGDLLAKVEGQMEKVRRNPGRKGGRMDQRVAVVKAKPAEEGGAARSDWKPVAEPAA
jgi:DNA-binding response OmpR family regulator